MWTERCDEAPFHRRRDPDGAADRGPAVEPALGRAVVRLADRTERVLEDADQADGQPARGRRAAHSGAGTGRPGAGGGPVRCGDARAAGPRPDSSRASPRSCGWCPRFRCKARGAGSRRFWKSSSFPGAEGRGVRLVVNEIPYQGPQAAGRLCLGPGKFFPATAGPNSFVLADKLAFCRFTYLDQPQDVNLPAALASALRRRPPGRRRYASRWRRWTRTPRVCSPSASSPQSTSFGARRSPMGITRRVAGHSSPRSRLEDRQSRTQRACLTGATAGQRPADGAVDLGGPGRRRLLAGQYRPRGNRPHLHRTRRGPRLLSGDRGGGSRRGRTAVERHLPGGAQNQAGCGLGRLHLSRPAWRTSNSSRKRPNWTSTPFRRTV